MHYNVNAKYTELDNGIVSFLQAVVPSIVILVSINLIFIFIFEKQLFYWAFILFFSLGYGQNRSVGNKKVIATIPFKIDQNTMMKILKRHKVKFEVNSEEVIKVKLNCIAAMMKMELIIRLLDNKVEIEGIKYMVENIIRKIEDIS